MQIDEAINNYIKMRDDIDEIKKRHAAELEPFYASRKQYDVYFLEALGAAGAKNIATDFGTVYQKISTSAKVADWDEVLAFIREHGLWHMLEKRVAKVAVEEYLEENGNIPPGVSVVRDATIGVRRPTK